jgi:hypothetical protein
VTSTVKILTVAGPVRRPYELCTSPHNLTNLARNEHSLFTSQSTTNHARKDLRHLRRRTQQEHNKPLLPRPSALQRAIRHRNPPLPSPTSSKTHKRARRQRSLQKFGEERASKAYNKFWDLRSSYINNTSIEGASEAKITAKYGIKAA